MIMLGFFTILTMACLTMRAGILGKRVGSSLETETALREDYIDGHESLDSADGKFPSCILGEAMYAEIEPTLRVDPVTSLDTIVDAAEPVLYRADGTWNSDIWRTSWTLPDSKAQSMCM